MCPNVCTSRACQLMILLPNSVILSGLDFNFDFEQTLGCSRLLAGNPHAPRQTRFLADHDASATDNFPALRRRAPRRSQGQGLYLLGSVSRNGLCAIDLSGVASRYRSQSARTGQASLPHGISLCDAVSQYAGQCERDAALADLCRLCSAVVGPAKRTYGSTREYSINGCIVKMTENKRDKSIDSIELVG